MELVWKGERPRLRRGFQGAGRGQTWRQDSIGGGGSWGGLFLAGALAESVVAGGGGEVASATSEEGEGEQGFEVTGVEVDGAGEELLGAVERGLRPGGSCPGGDRRGRKNRWFRGIVRQQEIAWGNCWELASFSACSRRLTGRVGWRGVAAAVCLRADDFRGGTSAGFAAARGRGNAGGGGASVVRSGGFRERLDGLVLAALEEGGPALRRVGQVLGGVAGWGFGVTEVEQAAGCEQAVEVGEGFVSGRGS